MSPEDKEYFARRAMEEVARAANSDDATVARIHLEMAALYSRHLARADVPGVAKKPPR